MQTHQMMKDNNGAYSMHPKNPIRHHPFTKKIVDILQKHFKDNYNDIFEASALLGYINLKTKSANHGSKARGAFANHYALYVVIEDYVKKGYFSGLAGKPYSKYEGAKFSDLLQRQRKLPFGAKLQNHALNSRLNDEFKKFYPAIHKLPIVRDVGTQRYWIQEDLLLITTRQQDGKDYTHNIALALMEIIDAYVVTKKAAFTRFLETCRQIMEMEEKDPANAIEFVTQQLQPNVDARIFEIVSYAVLKAKYSDQSIWFGETEDTVEEIALTLYKTGRTNANDGGIDFVMKPIGRFFQVTETIEVNKYFLDIDKVQRFPITFIVKSTDSVEQIRSSIRAQAITQYRIEAVVDTYMKAIEEIINISGLLQAFDTAVRLGKLPNIMEEIIVQGKVEFNHSTIDN